LVKRALVLHQPNIRVPYLWLFLFRHQPSILFEPPAEDGVENTGAVDQESLAHPQWHCEGPAAATKTLVIHNGDTALHYSSAEGDHPERPERTVQIMDELEKRGLTSKCDVRENKRSATDEELEAVHERPYIRRMKSTAEMSEAELHVVENGLNSIFLARDTFHIASSAAGAVLEGVFR
ncbi:hypothetical protein COOONC_01728, partial [Cooperia oncophora]